MTGAAMWTEQDIRKSLDGTFMKLKASGKFEQQKVPLDFIPSHTPLGGRNRQCTTRAGRRLWTREEHMQLYRMMGEGMTQASMARRLGRAESVVGGRAAKIRAGQREVL
jgi:hypothetical protein